MNIIFQALLDSMKNIGIVPDCQFCNMLIRRRSFRRDTSAAKVSNQSPFNVGKCYYFFYEILLVRIVCEVQFLIAILYILKQMAH